MKRLRLFILGFIAGLAWVSPAAASNVRWSIGVNLGPPPIHVYPRPYYPHYPYRPSYVRPIYYEPAPIIVRPAPVIYEPAPVYVPAPRVVAPAPVRSTSAPLTPVIAESSPTAIDAFVHLLRNPDEKVRADAALDLGRSNSDRAVDPLAATLAGDRSPTVRDAAARALGLLGSPRGLTALNYAGASDPDRDVRRSAQFAAEVINNRRD